RRTPERATRASNADIGDAPRLRLRRIDPLPCFARTAGAGDNGGPGRACRAAPPRKRCPHRRPPRSTNSASEPDTTMSETPKILSTLTDEAPWLATQSLLPVVQAYAATAGIAVDTRDISLAARILSQFPEALRDDQRVADDLAELGDLA